MRGSRWCATSIFVIVLTIASHAAGQERFVSPTAGIGMQPPRGWHSATLEQVQQNRERVRLSDPELQAALRSRSALPVAAFMRYAEPHAGLNPSIQVTLRPSLNGTATRLLSAAIEQMRRAFADLRIVSPVQAAEVGGRPGAHVRVAYTLRSEAGESFKVLSRIWMVPRGALMFLIGMSGGAAGDELCEAEFAAAFESIEIQD
jgi:hypothetical protein